MEPNQIPPSPDASTQGPAPLRIGELEFTNPVCLAPMAGVTNAVFRDICAIYARQGRGNPGEDGPVVARPASGCAVAGLVSHEGMFVGEMITAKALRMGSTKSWAMAASGPEQSIRSLQLYGVNGSDLAWCVREMIARNLVDHVDLNFGCPVPKVTRKGGGSALPWKTSYFAQVLTSVVRAAEEASREFRREVPVPVTVKIRSGIDVQHSTFLQAARAAQDSGVAAITLHARTTAQYYGGHSSWGDIVALVEAVSVPVLGNGDIFSSEDAVAMLRETGCAGVQIGRGVQGRPWIFREVTAALWGQPVPPGPTLGEICNLAKTHAAGLVQHYGTEVGALRDMRKHLGWYFRGFGLGGEVRAALSKVETLQGLEEVLAALQEHLGPDTPYPPAAAGKHGRSGVQKKVRLPEGWLSSTQMTKAEIALLQATEDDSDLGTYAGF